MQEFTLPANVKATTSVAEALAEAQFAVHAVPVQHTRRFLDSIKVVCFTAVDVWFSDKFNSGAV